MSAEKRIPKQEPQIRIMAPCDHSKSIEIFTVSKHHLNIPFARSRLGVEYTLAEFIAVNGPDEIVDSLGLDKSILPEGDSFRLPEELPYEERAELYARYLGKPVGEIDQNTHAAIHRRIRGLTKGITSGRISLIPSRNETPSTGEN